MKKQKQQRGQAKPRPSTPQAYAAHAASLANAPSKPLPAAGGRSGAAVARLKAGARTTGFKAAFAVFLAGVAMVATSLSIQHDFAFFELGYLFTLSIYDLVLAMLGLSIAIGMAGTIRQVQAITLGFLAPLVPMLAFFDPIFSVILASPLGHELFLIAPAAVMLSGAVLWLPEGLRRYGAPLAAAVVGFSLSLFIGLDDFGIGIKDFMFSAVLGALWILIVPGMMLRPFRGEWLTIPARIIGSWLVVIGIIVTVSLYVPLAPNAPPPPLPTGSQPDAPAFPPLDPAMEEGLIVAPDLFSDEALQPDQPPLPEEPNMPNEGENPLFNSRPEAPSFAPSITPPALP